MSVQKSVQLVIPQVNSSLEHYRVKLVALEQASQPSCQQILDVLAARDAVHVALNKNGHCAAENLLALIKLDNHLKQHADLIARTANLAEWRVSLPYVSDAWWWSFEAPPNWWLRFERIWDVLAILFLIIALSLLTDISLRFLSDGPDTLSIYAVVIQSVLTAVAAGGILTKSGREAMEQLFAKVPKHFRPAAKLGLVAIFLLSLIFWRFSLPRMAVYYNNLGLARHTAGQLASAQYDYTRALNLSPDYPEAHYNLGVLYEDMQEFDQAQIAYKMAVRGGLDAAYNNLARLYILDERYADAGILILNGLERVEDDTVKYTMLKNIGWARLGQSRYREAEVHLRNAIDIAYERAPAHCLLAQTLEDQNKVEEARSEWNTCLKYANGRNVDEDIWIAEARKRLSAEEDEQ